MSNFQGMEDTYSKEQSEDRIEIVFYTDPLCCWSWAFEKVWQRLQAEFKDKLSWRYCMGGLIPDWATYHDPMNSVSRPAQMGPLWMEAQHLTGTSINYEIWMKDPPASSYPACIAVKSAEFQSLEAGEAYLRALREAVMIKGKNIAKPEVLVEIGEQLSHNEPQLFDSEQFISDLSGEESRNAFRKDLQKVSYNHIGRFPTLTITKPRQGGVIITGYRPYEVLLQALSQVDAQFLAEK